MIKEYKLFWKWFLHHENAMKDLNLNNPLIEELDEKINKLGDFIWEIGPGLEKAFAFTISPGGDAKLLIETQKIISYSPILDEWEFYYSKQVKEWDNYFDIVIKGEKNRIDVSNWEYVLLQYDDDILDIIIKPVPYIDKYNEDISGIAEMVIDSIVGEEMRIKKIQDLEVVKEFNPDITKGKTSILNLRNHLKKLRSVKEQL